MVGRGLLQGTAWILSFLLWAQARERQEKTQLGLVFWSVFICVESMIDFPSN